MIHLGTSSCFTTRCSCREVSLFKGQVLASPLEAPAGRPHFLLVHSWEKVWKTLQSFSEGSAGWRDGLRPQLLVDMILGVADLMEEVRLQGTCMAHVKLSLNG